jgi:hypothetical protein
MKILNINLPQYNISTQPNYTQLGNIVDKEIVNTLPNGKYLIRGIGSQDHPNLTYDELIEKITLLGTDKYDKDRKSVVYEDFKEYDYDIQASEIEIKEGKLLIPSHNKYPSIFGEIIYDFYENALQDRGYRVRVDILMIYDITRLHLAKPITTPKEWVKLFEKYLYKFKDGLRKKDALLAIFKIK